jgi:hypothetical protein
VAKKTDPPVPVPNENPKKVYRGRNLYFSDELQPCFLRMAELEKQTGVSISRQVSAFIIAGIKTMEKELPVKRRFKINDVEVQP